MATATPAPPVDPTKDPKKGAFQVPGTRDMNAAIEAYRQQQQQAGVRGPALQDAVDAFRKTQNTKRQSDLLGDIPPELQSYIKHSPQAMKQMVHGKGPAFKKLMFLKMAGKAMGYGKEQDQLQQHYGAQIDPATGQAKVDLQKGTEPGFNQWTNYVGQHLGKGLTPQEEAAIRGPQKEAVESSFNNAMGDESTRESMAGIDPRSGIAADAAGKLQNSRAQQLADVERNVVGQNLARTRDFETYGQGVAGQEEGQRQFNVGTGLGRTAQVESGMAGLAGLGEQQRQYDLGFTESQRSAAMSRKAIADAANKAKPSTLETVAGGISGVIGGATGGGGGGGGGGGI